jgi:uncharacterized protein YpbB
MFRNGDDIKPYKDFNQILKQLFREIQAMFPNVPEAKKPIMYYKLLKTINKRQPQKRFQQMLGPYIQYIADKNESFFLTSFSDDGVADMMGTIRQLWTALNTEQKDRMWQYMQTLVHLSYVCEMKKKETMKSLF